MLPLFQLLLLLLAISFVSITTVACRCFSRAERKLCEQLQRRSRPSWRRSATLPPRWCVQQVGCASYFWGFAKTFNGFFPVKTVRLSYMFDCLSVVRSLFARTVRFSVLCLLAPPRHGSPRSLIFFHVRSFAPVPSRLRSTHGALPILGAEAQDDLPQERDRVARSPR